MQMNPSVSANEAIALTRQFCPTTSIDNVKATPHDYKQGIRPSLVPCLIFLSSIETGAKDLLSCCTSRLACECNVTKACVYFCHTSKYRRRYCTRTARSSRARSKLNLPLPSLPPPLSPLSPLPPSQTERLVYGVIHKTRSVMSDLQTN